MRTQLHVRCVRWSRMPDAYAAQHFKNRKRSESQQVPNAFRQHMQRPLRVSCGIKWRQSSCWHALWTAKYHLWIQPYAKLRNTDEIEKGVFGLSFCEDSCRSQSVEKDRIVWKATRGTLTVNDGEFVRTDAIREIIWHKAGSKDCILLSKERANKMTDAT